MSIEGGDINLQIALTILQFIALALPAIYLFAQVRDYDFSSSTRQLTRMSVVSYVTGAVTMLVAILSNVQASPGGTFISRGVEATILLVGIVFTVLGTVHFGAAVAATSRPIEMDKGGFFTHYLRAVRILIIGFLQRRGWR